VTRRRLLVVGFATFAIAAVGGCEGGARFGRDSPAGPDSDGRFPLDPGERPLPDSLPVLTLSNAFRVSPLSRLGFGSGGWAAFSSDGRTLAFTTGAGLLRIYDADSHEEIARWQAHRTTFAIDISPDDQLIITGDEDGIVKYWGPLTGREIRSLDAHRDSISEVRISHDGALFATGSFDQTVKVWDLPTGRLLHLFKGHTDWVRRITFSPDGRLLSSGGIDGAIWFWDPIYGGQLRTFTGHTDGIFILSVTHDGCWLISAGYDGDVRLWDPATGLESHRIADALDLPFDVAIDPDGTFGVINRSNGSLQYLDLESGRECPPQGKPVPSSASDSIPTAA